MCTVGSDGEGGMRSHSSVSVYNIAGNRVLVVYSETAMKTVSIYDDVRSQVANEMRVPRGLLIILQSAVFQIPLRFALMNR